MEHLRRMISRTERNLLERGNETLEKLDYRHGIAVGSALVFFAGLLFVIVR